MFRIAVALVATLLLVWSFVTLERAERGLSVRSERLGPTPMTIRSLPGAEPAPVVVIGHGFAGSRQLMAPLAITLARAGYVTVSYDSLGHGRNAAPLSGDVTTADGATAALVSELREVMARARAFRESNGRIALAGHSMATDIIVRAARAEPDVAATIGISLYSNEVTADEPRNLLIVVGAGEPGLKREALRVTGLHAAPSVAEPGATYGDPASGTARRTVFAPGVEPVGVLYSATMLKEAQAWLDAAFARDPTAPRPDLRGWPILGWIVGFAGLAWALAPRLPTARPPPDPARRFWRAALLPAFLVPPLAWAFPAGFLPMPVADYLTVHFALYGVITALLSGLRTRISVSALLPAALLASFALLLLYLPLDRYVAAFVPHGPRLPVMVALTLGIMPWLWADEALVRAPGAPRGAGVITKLMFLLSLGFAIALDTERLFFLMLILPVLLLFFLLFGALARWAHAATGSALPAALAHSLLFAWALAVTFPILGA